MSVMIFAMSITASAAATNIKQTEGTKGSVKISWESSNGAADNYRVIYSTSENGKYNADSSYTTSLRERYISGLDAGKTYYVKVESYSKGSTKPYSVSKPLQVVTAPIDVTSSSIKQTAGTTSSATIKWSGVKGATGYIIVKKQGNSKKSTSVRTNSVKLKTSAGQRYSVDVIAFRKSNTGFIAKAYSSTKYGVVSAPSVPMYFANASKGGLTWSPTAKKNTPTLYWTNNPNDQIYPDGYQIEFYTVDGKKKIAAVKTSSKSYTLASAKNYKLIKNKGFKTRIRAYSKNDSATCYGKWSGMTTVIPEAAIKLTATSHTSVKVSWSKVANAVKYRVYVSRDSGYKDSGHWSMKEVSASTTSYNITGLKKWKDFGVYVVPVVKVNGKLYKASKLWYTYSYVY